MSDPLLEELRQMNDADTVRWAMKMNKAETPSKVETEILFAEIDRLRSDRAALETMARYFAGKFRGEDSIAGKVAAAFYERFGEI